MNSVATAEALTPDLEAVAAILRLGATFAAGAIVSPCTFAKLTTRASTTVVEFCGIKVRSHPYLGPGQIMWTDAQGRVLFPPKQGE